MNRTIKIIWIDNDIDLLNDAEPVFAEYGFEITKCTSIAQGLNQINEGHCENLLLDIDFPNSPKEGIIFLEELRKIKPKMKVVIFTGFPDSDDTVKTIRDLYAVDYIKKPIPCNPSQLHFFFDKLKMAFNNSNTMKTSSVKNETFLLNKLMILLIFIFGVLSSFGGIIAIILSNESEISIKLFGQELKTFSVGVALFFIGGLLIATTFKRIIKRINK